MAVESDFGQRLKALRKQTIKSIKRQAIALAVWPLEKTGVLDRFGDDAAAQLPRAVSVSGITDEFKSAFLSLIADSWRMEGVFGHFTHFDHIVLSHGCEALVQLAAQEGYANRLNRIAITLASTVGGGQQSAFMRVMYPKTVSYADERSTTFFAVTRKEDVETYKLKPSVNEKRPLIALLKKGETGIILPAGGSVEPGRHFKDKTGRHIKGLQRVTDTDLISMNKAMEKYGKVFYLPIAVINTWKFFDSDWLLPTLQCLAFFYYDRHINIGNRFVIDFAKVFDRFGISPDIRIDIKFGMPITPVILEENLGSDWRSKPQEVNDYIMTEIARLHSDPYARGYYGQSVQEELVTAQPLELIHPS